MKEKQTKYYHALITAFSLIPVMILSVVKYNANPQLPLLFGCVVAGLVAYKVGYTWDEIRKSMLNGISQSLEAILILILIGVLIAVWVSCGTVPAMVCYGLQLITPQFFLITAFLLCSVVSMAIGSWGSAGTVGLAFMGIGRALEMPDALIAGAVVSGAYLGDKLSPLSDSTNLTAAVSNCDVLDMVRNMFKFVIKVFAAVAVIYLLIGLKYKDINSADIAANLQPLIASMQSSFKINIFSLTPLVIMLTCILLKIPAIPSIIGGIAVGFIQAVFIQGHSVVSLLNYCFFGYASQTGVPAIDKLLSAGGLNAMMYAISLSIIAMAFGGIMKGTNQMQALITPIVKHIHTLFGMTILTVMTCIGLNIVLPDQYMGIAVSGQMYEKEYRNRKIDPRILANTLGAGAVTSPLVPWNTCGVYISTVLGVSTLSYFKFTYFCLLMPVAIIIYGYCLSRKEERFSALK